MAIGIACAIGVAVAGANQGRALVRAAPTDFDDAYMYLRYARNALDGHWFVWNPGEAPVYGVTSLLHLVAVTLLRWLAPGLGDAAVLQLGSGLAALALLVVLAMLCARLGPDSRPYPERLLLWGGVLVLGFGSREAFFFHAHSGMDTMLAALANALVAIASLRLAERPSRARALTAAVLGLLAIEARPDDVIIATLCPVLALGLLAPARRAATATATAMGLRGAALTWAGAFGGLVLVDVALKWWLVGTPVPLAFYAKRPGYYRGFAGEFTWNPFLFLEVALATVWPFLVATMVFARRDRVRLLLVLLVPAAASIVALFSVNHIMGHLGRFFFPASPLIVAAGAGATGRWLGPEPQTDTGATPARGHRFTGAIPARLAGALLALLGGAWALEAAGRRHERRAETQELATLGGYRVSAAAPLPELDSWEASQDVALLAAAAPPGTTFAMSEHGLVGARAPRAVLIDLLGLHDRTFALAGFSAAELWRRRPEVIWMPHPDHTQMLRDILDSEELWRHYVFYPDAFTYGLALRRDGPHFTSLAELFSRRWRAAYPGVRSEDHVARRAASPGAGWLVGGAPWAANTPTVRARP
jgi:hypothetical protein